MRLFIVDDDPISRMALAQLAAHLDLGHPREFDDGDAAWAVLEAGGAPLLVLADVRMPKVSGLELLRRIRTAPYLSGVRVVLVTAVAEADVVAAAVRHGASGYILKPFAMRDTVPKVRAIVDEAWQHLGEEPGATARRLGVSLTKLAPHYDALHAAAAQLVMAVESGAVTPAAYSAQLDALHTGAVTLGLWHADRLIAELQHRPPHGVAYLHALVETIDLQRFRAARGGVLRVATNE